MCAITLARKSRASIRSSPAEAVPGQTKLTKVGRPPPSHVPGRGVGGQHLSQVRPSRLSNFSTPAFGFAQMRAPARCISLKGYRIEIGRGSPLREMTSAAYGSAGRLDC
jgi:hypothetical protein